MLDTTGSGPIALGDGSPAGDLDLSTAGYDAVSGATAGARRVANAHAEALMRAVLPAGAFTRPSPSPSAASTPASLPPEGDVDPVAAYRFEFGVPTLNSPAELSFDVRLAGLDAATRDALLAALADGRATLATKGDAPGSAFQTFPLCAAGQAPSAGGCVLAEHRGDAVRFTGIAGHFSTWAVAIVAKPPRRHDPDPDPDAGRPAASVTAPPRSSVRAPSSRCGSRRADPRTRPARIRVVNGNAFAVTGRLAGTSVKRLGQPARDAAARRR